MSDETYALTPKVSRLIRRLLGQEYYRLVEVLEGEHNDEDLRCDAELDFALVEQALNWLDQVPCRKP
jgi:hypothetical protein